MNVWLKLRKTKRQFPLFSLVEFQEPYRSLFGFTEKYRVIGYEIGIAGVNLEYSGVNPSKGVCSPDVVKMVMNVVVT